MNLLLPRVLIENFLCCVGFTYITAYEQKLKTYQHYLVMKVLVIIILLVQGPFFFFFFSLFVIDRLRHEGKS